MYVYIYIYIERVEMFRRVRKYIIVVWEADSSTNRRYYSVDLSYGYALNTISALKQGIIEITRNIIY